MSPQIAARGECQPTHLHWKKGVEGVCGTSLFGLALLLVSGLATALLFTLLVGFDSHTWIYIQRRSAPLNSELELGWEKGVDWNLTNFGNITGRGTCRKKRQHSFPRLMTEVIVMPTVTVRGAQVVEDVVQEARGQIRLIIQFQIGTRNPPPPLCTTKTFFHSPNISENLNFSKMSLCLVHSLPQKLLFYAQIRFRNSNTYFIYACSRFLHNLFIY